MMKKMIRPRKVHLDASTVCQLKCPSCPTASGNIAETLGSGFLKFIDFKNFLDDHPGVSRIELSNWGEIFLNKELIQIMSYAYNHNVGLSAGNGVNLNTVDDGVIAALVKYRFRNITCSIDGASQETYSRYRQNGNFNKVIENIKKINSLKRIYHSRYPVLRWQFVVFGHNEHEIAQARRLAKKLGMSFYLKLSWDDLYGEAFSPVKNAALVKKELGLGVANRQDFFVKYKRDYMATMCYKLWRRPQINYDGRLLGCSINYWGDYGNVFKHGFGKCWNGEKINNARNLLMGKRPMADDIPCLRCKIYERRKVSNRWVKEQEISLLYIKEYILMVRDKKFFLPRLMRKIIVLLGLIEHKLKLLILRLTRQTHKGRITSKVYPLQIPLSLDRDKQWQAFPIFNGLMSSKIELSCHVSALVPGHSPHAPHRHAQEELLLLLSGEVDLILPEREGQSNDERWRLKRGEFVYYPCNFAHTLKARGESPANYLMFKWQADRPGKDAQLTFGAFDMFSLALNSKIVDGFQANRIFTGRTAYLSKLKCHVSVLMPNAGYKSHADHYVVAIVVLKGQVETLGQRVSSYGVIFYAAGEPHGMYNPGPEVAQYLVFEFYA